jgi:hypothetical protein
MDAEFVRVPFLCHIAFNAIINIIKVGGNVILVGKQLFNVYNVLTRLIVFNVQLAFILDKAAVYFV